MEALKEDKIGSEPSGRLIGVRVAFNVYIKSGGYFMILRAESCARIDSKYYFMAVDINVFYSVNIDTHELLYEGNIPNEDVDMYRGAKIIGYHRDLVFIPLNSKYVSIYNVDIKEWKQIEVQNLETFENDKFFSAYIYKDKLFLIGASYPAIMILNLKDYSVLYEKKMLGERIKDCKEKLDCIIRSDIACVGNQLYIASCVSNHVGRFNLDDYSWEWYSIGKEVYRYSGIAWDGKSFWLAPRYIGNIVKWNPDNDEYEEIVTDNRNFLGVIYDGKQLIFPGAGNNETVIIEKENNSIKKIEKSYLFYLNNGENNVAMTSTGEFIIYSTGDLLHGSVKKSVNTDSSEFLQKFFEQNAVFYENGYIKMKDYIKNLIDK